MLSAKALMFSKRTLSLLLPLPCFTFGLRVFSAGDDADIFSVHLGHHDRLKYGDGRAISLARNIRRKMPHGRSIVDRGSILEVGDLTIEQLNPFGGDFFGFEGEYWYREAKIKEINAVPEGGKIYFDHDVSDGKYSLSLESYEGSDLRGRGDLHLVSELEITVKERKIPLMTIVPLQDLIYDKAKEHEIFTVSQKKPPNSQTDQYNFSINKNTSAKSLELKLSKAITSRTKRSPNSPIEFDLKNIKVNGFYFLFTLNPPLDFSRIFTEEQESEVVGRGPSSPSTRRQIHLANWKNGTTPGSTEPTYTLSRESGFWKSICRDPYKIGGWIDSDLTQKSKGQADDASKKISQESTNIKKQMNSWEEFKVGFNVKPKPKKQYYWEEDDYKGPPYNNKSIPSTDYTTPTPCQGMDEGTAKLYQEFTAEGKSLEAEPDGKKITFIPPIKYFEEAKKNGTAPTTSETEYPVHKVIQSSFRAWGNGITEKGNPMDEGVYSSLFEEFLQTEHTFSLKINKDTALKQLVEHSKLTATKSIGGISSKYNELPQVSSLLKLNVPFSYAVYDPLTNYYRKNRIILTVDLDMRGIYNQSTARKTLFTQDLNISHGLLGHDHKGGGQVLDNNPFGVNGILEFSSSLSHDLDGNIYAGITAKTKGFVNTKRADCDLRHRTFKWNNGGGQIKCFDNWNQSKKYRKHNHIPSFLIVTLEKDPTVSSFYVDRTSGLSNITPSPNSAPSGTSSEITTLSGFKNKISNPTEVRRTLVLDKSKNGEVYFDSFAVYNKDSKQYEGDKTQLSTTSWLSTTHYTQISYYRPRKNTNSLVLEEGAENLSSIVLFLGGADALSSYFFKSGHYGTMMTLCLSNKKLDSGTSGSDCGDGINYEKIEKDKRSSELLETVGSQKLELNWSEIKEKKTADNPLKINFRTVIQSSNSDKEKFDANKTKYEKVFKTDAPDITKENKGNSPDFSYVGVWYSLDLWYEESSKTLNYSTKVRPISHTPTLINNYSNEQAIGALGSAGFQIRSMELVYKKQST